VGSTKRFDSFLLDTTNHCLWEGEARADLTPKAFDVLRYLVEHAGQLVTQEELLEALWPGTYVNPEVLRKYILQIRRVLGDRPAEPRFIETLPRRGYYFIAPVTEESTTPPMPLAVDPAVNIVGREPSLAALQQSLGKALHGQRQIVLVGGEAGIGKTTLLDEFQRRAAAHIHSLRIARGQCVEGYGGREAYYPVLEALGGMCQGAGAEPLVEILATQAPTWLVQFPALVKREHRRTLHREIQGATRERMLREICEALETITSENPLLLLLEDLHWSDQSTVDFISALARRRQSAKLMFIGTYRMVELILAEHPLKDLKQDLLMHHLCREVQLEPLDEGEVAEYLAAESGGAALPDGLAALLYRHSEGNPLFMVAALEHMTQRLFLSREKNQWKFNVPLAEIDLEVPESLHQMVEVQIDRLRPEEKRVLEVGSLESVGGFRFGVAPRAAIIDLNPEEFEEVCESLSRRHRILRSAGVMEFPDGTVTTTYEFVHALYREVCYKHIAPGRKAMLHRRMGEWSEAHLQPHNQFAAVLAGHFEEAGDGMRAIKYLKLAADTAGRRFEPRQAAEVLEHAFELTKRLPESERVIGEIEILQKLAAIYAVLGDEQRALEKYEGLVARASRRGLIDLEVRALVDMAWPLSWSSRQRSMEVVEQALRLNARQPIPLLHAKARASCFTQRIWSEGWSAQDEEGFQIAFAEIRQADERRNLAPYFVDCGFINLVSSKYREAHKNLVESRAIKSEAEEENLSLNNTYLAGQCLVPLSLLFLGEWGEALREIKDGIELLGKNAEHDWGQAVQLYRAWVHLYAMDFPGVLAICNSLPLVGNAEHHSAAEHPTAHTLAFRLCLFLMGSAETALGNYEIAAEHLLLAQADMDRPGVMFAWFWHMLLESALTELWLVKGDLERARFEADKFLKGSLTTAEHTWQALTWELNARVAMASEQWKRGEEYITRALSTMEGFEVPLAAWRVHATAFKLYQNSNPELAERHMLLSRHTIMKLADSLASDESLRQTFLSAPTIREILNAVRLPGPTTAERAVEP
jgi:DNA-binding winged helix-turn-helix (wHTH) protein/tetratricopeptide (TPR) repeat protein